MAPTSTLPDNPVYAFCPEYGPPKQPQQIRIVFEHVPGYVPTALVALTLADAERLCTKLNVRLGLDRDAWMRLAARAMGDARFSSRMPLHCKRANEDVLVQSVIFRLASSFQDEGGFVHEQGQGQDGAPLGRAVAGDRIEIRSQ